MIDLEAARARADWLTRLKPGDRVILHTPFGTRPADVVAIQASRITVHWRTGTLGGDVHTWIHRDTGDLPGGRLYIKPEPELDTAVGGWEAA